MDSESNSGAVRLFIAVAISADAREELRRAQGELRGAVGMGVVKWVRPEQMHLTLRFLGNVRMEQVEELTGAMRKACESRAGFGVKAQGIGFFPQARSPRVIWAGVGSSGGELAELQAAVSAAAEPFTREKAEEHFTGHLTLARVKSIRPAESRRLREVAEKMSGRLFGEWTVEDVEIIRSEMSSEGSRYSTVAEIRLGGGGEASGMSG